MISNSSEGKGAFIIYRLKSSGHASSWGTRGEGGLGRVSRPNMSHRIPTSGNKKGEVKPAAAKSSHHTQNGKKPFLPVPFMRSYFAHARSRATKQSEHMR